MFYGYKWLLLFPFEEKIPKPNLVISVVIFVVFGLFKGASEVTDG